MDMSILIWMQRRFKVNQGVLHIKKFKIMYCVNMVLKYIPDILVKSKQRQVLINVKIIILDPAMDKKHLAHRRRNMLSWMRLDISI